MEQPRITFILNGNTYNIAAGDVASIRNMPMRDRRQLIDLLEAVKCQDSLSLAAVSTVPARSRTSSVPSPTLRATATQITSSDEPSSRLGSGDIDAVMARLKAQEKRDRKQGLKKSDIYKVMGGFLLIVFLLVIIL